MKLHVLIASAWAALTAGQAVKASSLPVVIASDQLGAQAKAASMSVALATDQVGATTKAASLSVALATDQVGATTKAASLSVALATDQVGAAAKAAALAVTMATDQPAMKVKTDGNYETVAASQTDQALGATGATGDYLEQLLIIPGTTSPGDVSIKDGAGSAIPVFVGGASSVADLKPFPATLKLTSTGGAWKVTTGANVSVVASGIFT